MPILSSPTSPTTDDTLRAATAAAERILTAPARRRAAISYLRQRGIDGTFVPPDWPLGYAPPGWTRLTDTLRAEGFDDQTLLDAGLAHALLPLVLVQPDRGDRARNDVRTDGGTSC